MIRCKINQRIGNEYLFDAYITNLVKVFNWKDGYQNLFFVYVWFNFLWFCDKSAKEIALWGIPDKTYSEEMPFIARLKILLCNVGFVESRS